MAPPPRNWILIDRRRPTPNGSWSHSRPSTSSHFEQRISSINRLNERILQRRQRVFSPYEERVWPLPPPDEDARKVVDESFDFIDRELSSPPAKLESATGRLQRLIHRNSSGQIDAVYERRLARDNELAHSRTREDQSTKRIAPNKPLKPPATIDSASFRSPYDRPFSSGSIRRPLKRNTIFYRRCDVCTFRPLRRGEVCPACGSGAHWHRSHRPKRKPEVTIEPMGHHHLHHSQRQPVEQLNADHLLYSTYEWTPEPYWQDSFRCSPSPMFRYGSPMPRTLYDYEFYAEQQERKRRTFKRKRFIVAMTCALFAVALLVAAGVILAALA